MRKYPRVCFCLLLAWTLPAHAQQFSDKKQTNPDTLTQDAKQQVLDLEKKWVEAEIKHDEATLRRILDDKFVASFGAGKPYDKEAFIKGIVSGEVDLTESQTLTDRTVIIDGDTAVVVEPTRSGGRKRVFRSPRLPATR